MQLFLGPFLERGNRSPGSISLQGELHAEDQESSSRRLWRSRSAITAAHAETNKVRVGKVVDGNGFHIPSYIAMDQGFFKKEGLDASFVVLQGRALVSAALSGNADFVPIPSGGSQAALRGAEIRYVVGEVAEVAMDHRRAQEHQQGGRTQRQGLGLRPRRRRRL